MYGPPAVLCLPVHRHGLRAVIQDRVGENYGKINAKTVSIFNKYNWKSFLPDKELAARYCTEYIYDFKYAFLGDNSFYIYAVFQYDADSFAAEAARIEETPGAGFLAPGLH